MQPTDPSAQEKTQQRRLVASLHGIALLLLALHLYVRTFPPTPAPIPEASDPEAAWWGFWQVTYAPTWALWIGTGIVVGLIVFAWWGERGQGGRGSEGDGRYVIGGIGLVLLISFFLFPIAHTRWGDAYILAKGIAYPDPALRTVYSWQAPLDVFLHSQLWRWLGTSVGAIDDATPIYRLLSPLAGAIYLAMAVAISRDRRIAPAWFSFGLLASLGLLQLFYGYIENYSFVAAGILAYLWLGIGVLRGERPLWLAASVLALCNAFHPSTVVLAPSLLVLGWGVLGWGDGGMGRKGEREKGGKGEREFAIRNSPPSPRNMPLLSVVLEIGLPMLLLAGGTMLLMEWGGHGLSALLTTDRPGGGDASWFVPLWQTSTRWEHYTMFSWLHLRDWLNLQMLVAPAVGIIFIGWMLGFGFWGRHSLQNPESKIQKFLLTASASYLLLTFVWNPDYGGQRDWDLFSLSAIPLTLLLIVWLPTKLQGRFLRMGMMPLIALQSLHTIAWIYQNTLPWEWPK